MTGVVLMRDHFGEMIRVTQMKCRYCPLTDLFGLHLVFRDGFVEGYCPACFEEHCDDWKRPVP